MKLSEIGEFNFIKKLSDNFPIKNDDVLLGIGDDTAVINVPTSKLLITTDMLVEGVDFLRDKITPFQLGYKSMAVNLSDIASMGGKPQYALVSIALPKTTELHYVQEIYRGFKELLDKYKIDLIGGDTSSIEKHIVISITIIGKSHLNGVALRSNAKPSELIFVTKTLGDSSAGLKIVLENLDTLDEVNKCLIERHYMPKPFIEEANFLLSEYKISTMIDISDGLSIDLFHICEKSKVGAVIYKNKIPISEELKVFSQKLKIDPYEHAINGGEDFCLLFTIPKESATSIKEAYLKKFNQPIYEIGQITGGKDIYLFNPDGKQEDIHPKGFDHFA